VSIADQQIRPDSAPSPQSRSLLEGGFPYAEVSVLARSDRYSVDRVYAVHKWWARRPPAVIRALLLAATLPPSTSPREFWQAFGADCDPLKGTVVGDPFMGGATTLVEASRLGANVTGIDVDPLAVRVARVELAGLDRKLFGVEAEALLTHLRELHADLYPGSEGTEPLHYFRLRQAHCSECGQGSLMYRNLWLVRDRGLAGAVVRDDGGVVFCPDCRALHWVEQDRKTIDCCGHRHRIERGTYARGRFDCPNCGTAATNDELKVGNLPNKLIAVEETIEGKRRAMRMPTLADHEAIARAKTRTAGSAVLCETPLGEIDSGRPASYGFETVADLFLDRQRAVIADAFSWIRRAEAPAGIQDALLLAVSNALGSNNALCGYATDYGRLSSLFSAVRAYSIPVLSVELNPLHTSAGRGTLAATLRRLERSGSPTVRRHTIDPIEGTAVHHNFKARGRGRRTVRCSSADRALPIEHGAYDLVLTDPPYFDFIPYSDLSLLYRAWLAPESHAEQLGGKPIYPVGDDPATEFATRLAGAFRNVRAALKPGRPMIFTFHSPHKDAWDAVEAALRTSDFRVNAVFPVWADGRGGSHGHTGNCEWDLVFVCRDKDTTRRPLCVSVKEWVENLKGETIETSDRASMELGLALAKRLST
jgi:putative DNA methylase